MEFSSENWLYFASAEVMAFMMFKGSGCSGGHFHDTQSHDGSSKAGGVISSSYLHKKCI